MKNNAVFIDAFSTLHVGNGALLDNSYKLAIEHLRVEDIHIVTADTETNKDRYKNVIDDVFSTYPKTKIKKYIWTLWYLLNCAACWIYISLNIPFKYWIISRKFKDIFSVIQKSDFVISISGETLNDYFAPQMYMRCVMFYLCIKLGKRFCIFPQSIGPVFRSFSVKMLRFCLGKAEVIFARDNVSFELSKKIWKGCSVVVSYCPDVAVTQESVAPTNNEQLNSSKKIVGITLSNPPEEISGGKNYVDTMISVISANLDHEKHSILLMPSNYKKDSASDDYQICTYAEEKFKEKGFSTKILPNEIIHPDIYQGIQKTLSLFISSRMHVGILATSAGTPTIMLNTQHKIRGYMENIEMGEYVVEYQGLEVDMPRLISQCFEKNQIIRDQLNIQNNRMRKKLSDTFTHCFK